MRLKPSDIPADFPVRPLGPKDSAKDRVTCGTCCLSWDDAIVTGLTPAPSARCPFEYFHKSEEPEAHFRNHSPDDSQDITPPDLSPGPYMASGQFVVASDCELVADCYNAKTAQYVTACLNAGGDSDAENGDAMRERARAIWARDDIQIDNNARISVAENGAWVAAWVWVADEE